MFIGDWMERGARYWPDNLAVVDVAKGDAGRFTYAAMNRRADAAASWLKARTFASSVWAWWAAASVHTSIRHSRLGRSTLQLRP